MNINQTIIADDCGSLKDEVYTHTLVVALSCLPFALFVGLTINMLGKKLVLGKSMHHELCNCKSDLNALLIAKELLYLSFDLAI